MQAQTQSRIRQASASAFSKCNLVTTEANHDLHNVINTKLNRDYQVNGIMAINLDNTRGTGCDPFLTNRQSQLFNDYQITEMITGYTPEGFKNISQPDNNHIITIPIVPLVRPPGNDNNISSIVNGGVTCKKITKRYYSNLNRLFNIQPYQTTRERNIYLVIDTGDDLVKKLGGSLNREANGINYNIHVIHSPLTLADSAKKTRPDSKNYTTNFYPRLKQYSWLYNYPWEIASNNEVFMSKYKIINNLIKGGWRVNQEWYLPGNDNDPFFKTNNPHVDNNKTVVSKEIRTQQSTAQQPRARQNINLQMQKKRSGDHLSILAAKELPRLLNAHSERFKQVKTNSVNHVLCGKDIEYYKRNLFFVTGDWPAFAYAIYNRVNSIIIIITPEIDTSYILLVQFN